MVIRNGDRGENIIKINFSGTGIILYLLNYQKKGNLVISLDKQLIDDNDLLEDIEENEGEILIADQTCRWSACSYDNEQR